MNVDTAGRGTGAGRGRKEAERARASGGRALAAACAFVLACGTAGPAAAGSDDRVRTNERVETHPAINPEHQRTIDAMAEFYGRVGMKEFGDRVRRDFAEGRIIFDPTVRRDDPATSAYTSSYTGRVHMDTSFVAHGDLTPIQRTQIISAASTLYHESVHVGQGRAFILSSGTATFETPAWENQLEMARQWQRSRLSALDGAKTDAERIEILKDLVATKSVVSDIVSGVRENVAAGVIRESSLTRAQNLDRIMADSAARVQEAVRQNAAILQDPKNEALIGRNGFGPALTEAGVPKAADAGAGRTGGAAAKPDADPTGLAGVKSAAADSKNDPKADPKSTKDAAGTTPSDPKDTKDVKDPKDAKADADAKDGKSNPDAKEAGEGAARLAAEAAAAAAVRDKAERDAVARQAQDDRDLRERREKRAEQEEKARQETLRQVKEEEEEEEEAEADRRAEEQRREAARQVRVAAAQAAAQAQAQSSQVPPGTHEEISGWAQDANGKSSLTYVKGADGTVQGGYWTHYDANGNVVDRESINGSGTSSTRTPPTTVPAQGGNGGARTSQSRDGSYSGSFSGGAAGTLRLTVSGGSVSGSVSGTSKGDGVNASVSGTIDAAGNVRMSVSGTLRGQLGPSSPMKDWPFSGTMTGTLSFQGGSGSWSATGSGTKNAGSWSVSR